VICVIRLVSLKDRLKIGMKAPVVPQKPDAAHFAITASSRSNAN